MTQAFIEMAKIAYADKSRRKEMVEKLSHTILPNKYILDQDGRKQNIRELAMTPGLEENLIPVEVEATVIEGSNPSIFFRNSGIPVYNWPECGQTVYVPSAPAGVYAPKVAAGAPSAPVDGYITPTSVTIDTYSQSFGVTRELQTFAKPDILNTQLKLLGNALENALNAKVFDTFLLGCSQDADNAASSTNQGLTNYATAVSNVRKYMYAPDTGVVHPEFEARIMSQQTGAVSYFAPGGWQPDGGSQVTGIIPRLFGTQLNVWSGTYGGGTYTYSYDTNDDRGGLVFDKQRYGAVVIKEDISVEQAHDILYRMDRVVGTMMMGASVCQGYAGCRLQF